MKKCIFSMIIARTPFLLITLSFLFLTSGARGQSFQIDAEQPVQVTVEGGSTLHDWTVTGSVVKDYPTGLDLVMKEGNTIESFSFSVEVKSMKGGRGATMDNKIYAALKAEEYPLIRYRQTKPATLGKMGADGSFQLVSTGTLIMAGAEKPVTVTVGGILQDGVLTFSGSHPLKMSDFAIDPPSAMFGQIQTKDEIKVNFAFRYLLKK